jgi:signal transduction histidine kinase
VTRVVVWVVPLVGLLAALLGPRVDGVGWVVGLVLGALAGALVWGVEQAMLRRVTDRVQGWTDGGSDAPLQLAGGSGWRGLGTALDGLHGALDAARTQLGVRDDWTQRVVAALEVPALLFDGAQRLVVANDPARAVFGGPADGVGARSTLRVLGSAALALAVSQALDGGAAVRASARVGDRDLEVVATPLAPGVLLLVTDRSRQRRIEELRRDFVTNASHELKTPVTAITTLVGALRLVEGERAERIVDRLEEESQRLVTLVHDLLDLRRVDSGGDEDAMAPVDLVALVGEGTARIRGAADGREVAVVARLPRSAVVVGRRADLQLVVDNLLANAVKYNRDGGQVTVTITSEAGAQVLVVRDTGIGIARQEAARVFERFYRVDVARSRESGGTGLGLSIVRHVVEGHRGTVEVDSLLGEGTTFTVRLPVQPGGVLAPSSDRDDPARQ